MDGVIGRLPEMDSSSPLSSSAGLRFASGKILSTVATPVNCRLANQWSTSREETCILSSFYNFILSLQEWGMFVFSPLSGNSVSEFFWHKYCAISTTLKRHDAHRTVHMLLYMDFLVKNIVKY